MAEQRRNRYETQPMTPDVIASQQSLADRYFELGLLPKKMDVSQNVLNMEPEGSK